MPTGSRIVALLGALILVFVVLPRPTFAASYFSEADANYDLSFPECHDGYPSPPGGFAIVGVNGGRAFTNNPCFARQYQQVSASGQTPALYMNLNYPSGPGYAERMSGPHGDCSPPDKVCQAYNYGYKAAAYADQAASAVISDPRHWWLDIETANVWSSDTRLNADVIRGAIDYWHNHDKDVGIYSIAPMWHKIAGSYAPGVPNWVAQTRVSVPVSAYCSPTYAFGGGTIVMVQHWTGLHDIDFSCPNASAAPPTPQPTPTQPQPANGGPIALTSSASGTLAGSPGGTSRSYTFDYGGGNRTEAVILAYSPSGPVPANAFFADVFLNGVQIAHVQAIKANTPGKIMLTVSSASSGNVVIRLTNYNDPSVVPVQYTLTLQ